MSTSQSDHTDADSDPCCPSDQDGGSDSDSDYYPESDSDRENEEPPLLTATTWSDLYKVLPPELRNDEMWSGFLKEQLENSQKHHKWSVRLVTYPQS